MINLQISLHTITKGAFSVQMLCRFRPILNGDIPQRRFCEKQKEARNSQVVIFLYDIDTPLHGPAAMYLRGSVIRTVHTIWKAIWSFGEGLEESSVRTGRLYDKGLCLPFKPGQQHAYNINSIEKLKSSSTVLFLI